MTEQDWIRQLRRNNIRRIPDYSRIVAVCTTFPATAMPVIDQLLPIVMSRLANNPTRPASPVLQIVANLDVVLRYPISETTL